jgi:hypothetical protein
MRIDDYVWLNPRLAEWHVDRRILLRADTFLSVSRRELVSDDWGPRNTKFNVDLVGRLVSGIGS